MIAGITPRGELDLGSPWLRYWRSPVRHWITRFITFFANGLLWETICFTRRRHSILRIGWCKSIEVVLSSFGGLRVCVFRHPFGIFCATLFRKGVVEGSLARSGSPFSSSFLVLDTFLDLFWHRIPSPSAKHLFFLSFIQGVGGMRRSVFLNFERTETCRRASDPRSSNERRWH